MLAQGIALKVITGYELSMKKPLLRLLFSLITLFSIQSSLYAEDLVLNPVGLYAIEGNQNHLLLIGRILDSNNI